MASCGKVGFIICAGFVFEGGALLSSVDAPTRRGHLSERWEILSC